MDKDVKDVILKSETSLVGIVCKNGIVMGGDRRATLGGQIVAQKNCPKVIRLNDYLVISWTGSAADSDMLEKLARAQIKIKTLRDKKRPSVKEAANLINTICYQNIRRMSTIPFIAGSLLAGVNENGTTELYTINPAGSVHIVKDFDANISSGMPYILGMLERDYKKDLTIEEGIKLALDAIKASSERDTASGNGVDVFTITSDGIQHVEKRTVEKLYKEDN